MRDVHPTRAPALGALGPVDPHPVAGGEASEAGRLKPKREH